VHGGCLRIGDRQSAESTSSDSGKTTSADVGDINIGNWYTLDAKMVRCRQSMVPTAGVLPGPREAAC